MLSALKRKRSTDAKPSKPVVQEGPQFDQVNGAIESLSSDSEVENGDSHEESDAEQFPEFDPSSDTEAATTTDAESDDASERSFEVKLFPKADVVVSNITGQPKRTYPEIDPVYDSDSSTEEDPNRIGNVPLHWYDDLPHIGYNIDGKKVLRPARGDELDKFLATVEDPNSWTTAFDEKMQMERPLSNEELDIIRRLQQNEIPDANYNPYEPTVEWFTGKGKEEVMPLTSAPEPKRRWVASKWEKQKLMKIVRAIRQGRIVPSKPKTTDDLSKFYNIWSSEQTSEAPQAPPPRKTLPTSSESYNPPPEYLPTDEERKQWEETDPEDREQNYLPRSHSALRHVPAYDQFIQERFSRQLDLYLAPRVQRKRLNLNADDLVPKLPHPDTLRPFPLYRSLTVPFGGRVRCIATSPDGAWAISGDEKGVVSLWEVEVGKTVKQWTFTSKVTALEWCPRKDVNYFVVASEETLHALIPPHQTRAIVTATQALLCPATLPQTTSQEPSLVKWQSQNQSDDFSLTLHLPPRSAATKHIVFHRRGDYMATVSDGKGQISVWIHNIPKRHSQSPFKKVKGTVQKVLFHPQKAHFLVATQRYVRIYDLAVQKLLKTLQPGIKWISAIDLHPSGDHLLVSGYDRKLCWFDLELSEKPYKILRYHSRAIRQVCYHPSYPLFATCSDDGTIQIFHSRVYNDLMTDPLIVPLKILRGHSVKDGLGVLDIRWCAGVPWLVSGGADGNAAVWMA